MIYKIIKYIIFLLFSSNSQQSIIQHNVENLRKTKICDFLQNKNANLTEIINDLKWTEKTVIITLSELVTEGLIIEEFDNDSERWVYRLNNFSSINQNQHLSPIQEQAQKLLANHQTVSKRAR